ncbi:MAG: DMT family transporter [Candidatus Woesearchaeota archaeon]|nr:DMT family transporter [Candidatus Woesearchaeota archaeon]
MNLIAVGLILLSAVMHAVRNFYTKKSNDKQVFVWWYELVGAVLFLPVFAYYFWKNGAGGGTGILIGIVSGIIHGTYWITHSRAYEDGDLSHVYPIMRAAPLLVVPFAWIFLNEHISLVGFLGILLMVVGVYVVNMKTVTLKTLFDPIKAIVHERATQWAFVTLLLVTAYSLIDKAGVSAVHPMVFTYYFTVFGFIFFSFFVFTKKRGMMLREVRENKKMILLNGFLGVTGYALTLAALSLEKVSYATGLRQTSALFAVLMGGQLLQEKHKAIRFTAATLMVVGAVLISVAS